MTFAEVGAPPPGPGWVADDETFGARLAMIRQKMGWGNVAKAARECGVATDSWRNWETENVEPHRLQTIALAIATRAGCNYIWLCHGPKWEADVRTSAWRQQGDKVGETGRVGRGRAFAQSRIVKTIGQVAVQPPVGPVATDVPPVPALSPTRAVRQTRPLMGGSILPDAAEQSVRGM